MRTLTALCVLVTAGCLSTPGGGPRAAVRDTTTPALSQFDYVVLASLGDAGRPISLALYSPTLTHE